MGPPANRCANYHDAVKVKSLVQGAGVGGGEARWEPVFSPVHRGDSSSPSLLPRQGGGARGAKPEETLVEVFSSLDIQSKRSLCWPERAKLRSRLFLPAVSLHSHMLDRVPTLHLDWGLNAERHCS